jgi:cytochrome c peroxidase
MKIARTMAAVAAGGLLATLSLQAAKIDPSLRASAEALFDPVPYTAPVPDGNMVTPARVELGKLLFFDPRLSKSGTISCNTCHNLGMGGDDNRETSIGHGFAVGPRNSPTVYNAVFNVAQFWDGRAADLKEQAMGPIQAGVEMANTPDKVVETLASIPEYRQRFNEAFPGEESPITFMNVAMAIEAYETTLVTPDSRFDLMLKGDDHALSAEELRGLESFINKGCAACHRGVNLGGENYYTFGVQENIDASIRPEEDKGRFMVTNTEADEYVFRAGPLRNIALTAPYFHSGAVWDLREAVAIMSSSQLGIELSEQEIDDITAFLKTLTGDIPPVDYPQLPVETLDTPQPEL